MIRRLALPPMVPADLALVPVEATELMVEAAHSVEEKEKELLSFERTWAIMIAASPVQLVAASGAWSPAEWTQAIAKQMGEAQAGCWRCGALSEVLARILSLSGLDAKVVNGLANGTSHAWVEVEGVVYDPTAEQFTAPIKYEHGPEFLQPPALCIAATLDASAPGEVLKRARDAAASVFDRDEQHDIAASIRAGRDDHTSQVQAALAALSFGMPS